MAGLIIFAIAIGVVVTLVMIGISILLALAIKRFTRKWDAVQISTISSSIGPISAIILLIALIVDLNLDDTGLSGPEAQGIVMLVVIFFIVIVPGWWLGNRFVRRMMPNTDAS